ncbi:hypothetical protein EI94DRAFT_1006532 [Lactarius quietus]|nr:hypothetical protein EI94DRAFT_1006532 [Lactarius quietus]
MPSSSLLASLGHPDSSSASTPSKLLTTSNGKEKQRLLRQVKKLSQILGGPPHATVAPTLLVRGNPTVEVPPTGFSQLHVPSPGRPFTEPSSRSPRSSRIFHTSAASTMPPPPPPSILHDDSNRNGPKRLSSIIPAHINQLDLARFGLGGRQRSGSMISAHSDENASNTDHRCLVAETETLSDSSNAHSLDLKRPGNKPRWRSVYNPGPTEFDARSRRSDDSSMPAYSSKRTVSLWTKRAASNEGRRQPLADQRQDIISGMHPPLTESQRIMSLRRGRKLAQVFGTVPPIALYCTPSHVEEDEPATSDAVQREREKAYLALSSGDFCSVTSERSSRHRSHSSLSNASTVSISLPSPNNDVEASRVIESDQTSCHLLPDPGDDPASTAQGSRDRPEDINEFQRRRLRAAKLSRFFGVSYKDLIRQNGREGANPRAADVDVRIDGPGWSDSSHSSERGAQDADMNDVIALLRQMPRA